MRQSGWSIICIFLLSALAAVAGDISEDGAALVVAKINASVLRSWAVVEQTPNVIPEGHYWGQEYAGVRGEEILLQGSMDVHVSWQDRAGTWHTEAIGKEALKLYVMPSTYRESWVRFFISKRPISADLLFENRTVKIYAYPSFRIIEREKFDKIVKQSKAIQWPDSPENTRTLSWVSWREDLIRLLASPSKLREGRPGSN